MFRRHANKVTFQEVVAYWSEEEWESLHERQKELYKDVVMEIHQALIFLGYRIANPDSLLRFYKRDEVHTQASRGLEKRRAINHPTSACHSAVNPDILLRINHEEDLCCTPTRGAEETKICDSSSTGQPIITSVFSLRDKRAEVVQSVGQHEPDRRNTIKCYSTWHPAVNPDKLSRINLEEDICCSDTHSTEESKICDSPSTGDPIITSVFSLRDKKKEVVQPVRQHEAERRNNTCRPALNPDTLLKNNHEEDIYCSDSHSAEETEICESPSTACQPEISPDKLSRINHEEDLCYSDTSSVEEVEISSSKGHPIITAVFSLRAKKGEDVQTMGQHESEKRNNIKSYSNFPFLNTEILLEKENSDGCLIDHGGNERGEHKTRTKETYRMVYTKHQLVELEKEFYQSRYISISRKAELADTLGFTKRQVKIWFQNRRAKERKGKM